jgi:hypothetical protein
MRLTKISRRTAEQELLDILRNHPDGLRTSELQARGTPHFHGIRTLSSRQIIAVLRASRLVDEHVGGQGMRTYLYWQMDTTAYARYLENIRQQAAAIIQSWKKGPARPSAGGRRIQPEMSTI